jgi:hypothetical protein
MAEMTTEERIDKIEKYCMEIIVSKLGEKRIHEISEVKDVGDALKALSEGLTNYDKLKLPSGNLSTENADSIAGKGIESL